MHHVLDTEPATPAPVLQPSGTPSSETDVQELGFGGNLKKNAQGLSTFLTEHFKRHVGPGILASIAYFDPGNWTVDLQAGSRYGCKFLFVVLLAGVGAVILQTMSARLGCATGRDLAVHYLPSKTLLQPGALYTSVGILGATVMPHALFLGSSLATLDRVSPPPSLQLPINSSPKIKDLTLKKRFYELGRRYSYMQPISNGHSSRDAPEDRLYVSSMREMSGQRESHAATRRSMNNKSVDFIKQHLVHAMVDIYETDRLFTVYKC
ncbi:hypothetical protein RhiJN_18267 [Ceratobasidium sp. AG-Ba]|nr:hypothetical protein RhiJN_18267 [Ceratobasidium sp. AG-Ba]